MNKLFVELGKGYPIIIENNIINNIGERIRAVSRAERVCVVSDANVFPLYGSTLVSRLAADGFSVCEYVFEAGEASKTPETLLRLVDCLAAHALTRQDLVIALGGGVTGDLAGFAAAIYLRGIDVIQVPTSLLAQLDASVGGKTAVNLPQGKNLCGAFHQPLLVLIDPNTLRTLPPREFSNGIAEAVKMGCIRSASLFDMLAAGNAAERIGEIVFACLSLKAQIVTRDEREYGERALLNFGHTVGHAIEQLYDYRNISHGEAVGIGMLLICRAAEAHGLTEKGTADRISAVLETYHLRTDTEFSLTEIIGAMRSDKKRTADGIKLVLIKCIGEGTVLTLDREELPAFFGVNA